MAEKIAAFFDIDHTVLEINSGSKWIGYQWRTGQLKAWQVARAMTWLMQYRFGWLDFEAMSTRVIANYAGTKVEPIYEEVEAWFHTDVADWVCVEAREAIASHQRQGHIVALLTSATRFLSTPLARLVNVEHILCTEVEVQDGCLTGRHVRPACYGPGKVHHAEQFAHRHGIDLTRSYFYTDSVSDLPMLERVGEPRVINPDPRLKRAALQRGWSLNWWRAPASNRLRAKKDREHVGTRVR